MPNPDQRELVLQSSEKLMMLHVIDDLWTEFLKDTSNLQSGVALRSFSRMEPLDEFRLDAGEATLLTPMCSSPAVQLLSQRLQYK